MNESTAETVAAQSAVPVAKQAVISETEGDAFSVEYDTTVGTRNMMRLEANTYDRAIEEAKRFLGITGSRDENGAHWEIE